MISVQGTAKQACGGWTRREMLRLGGLSLLGLTFPELLRAESRLPAQAAKGQARSVILLYLFGGPAAQETFDPKPDAPSEFRGEFGSIPTSVPSVHFCEYLPRMARWMNRSTLIRSATHDQNDHSAGLLYTMTGAPPAKLESLVPVLPTQAPSMNAVVEYLARSERRTMPASVWMPCPPGWGQKIERPGPFGGWLGRKYDPLITGCELRETYEPKDFDTLVVVMGEMGRAPQVNARGGRDHWSYLHNILLTGAGVRQGLVYGSSDAKAYAPTSNPVSPADFIATVYAAMGIDPEGFVEDAGQRPRPITPDGKPIREVLL